MEPFRLPLELFDQIIAFAAARDDAKTLCDFCLVSRGWRANLAGRICQSWTFDDKRKRGARFLWPFLRSVLSSDQFAHGIREVRIENWPRWVHMPLRPSDHDMGLIRTAIAETGLQHMEREMLEAARKLDPRPFVALLLASLPNLNTIYNSDSNGVGRTALPPGRASKGSRQQQRAGCRPPPAAEEAPQRLYFQRLGRLGLWQL